MGQAIRSKNGTSRIEPGRGPVDAVQQTGKFQVRRPEDSKEMAG